MNIQILFNFTHRSNGIVPQRTGHFPNKVNSIWSTITDLGLKEKKKKSDSRWDFKMKSKNNMTILILSIFKVFQFSTYELCDVSVQKLNYINIHFSSLLGYYTFLFHGTAFTL